MIVKIYGMLWAFVAVAAGMFFLTRNFSEMTAVVFGFISFGMVFMGMIGVLPATIAHPAPATKRSVKTEPATKTVTGENKSFATAGQIPVH